MDAPPIQYARPADRVTIPYWTLVKTLAGIGLGDEEPAPQGGIA